MPAGQKRVLVVDDEEDLTWSISKNLAKDKDKYDLICVNSGNKALEVLSQLPVNLVISDIRMPELTGLELLVKIRDNYPSTKVIIMTAYGSTEVQEEANRLGCLKYIEKPFEISDLRQLILETISEKKGFQGKVSDFQLSDLIQLNCLSRLTSSLVIDRENEEGRIFFKEGNIVHATCGEFEGEEALYELLSWSGGNFSTVKNEEPPRETIIKGWQGLLLEGMRRLDESQKRASGKKENEKRKRIEKILDILDQISALDGVLLCGIFNSNGFPTATKLHDDWQKSIDISEIIGQVSALIADIEKQNEKWKFGKLKDLEIELDKGIIKLNRIPAKQEYLVVFAQLKTPPARLNLEMRKQLKTLGQYV